MNLTHQDIQAILGVLDKTEYDELKLEVADCSVYFKRSADGWSQQHRTLKTATPLSEFSAVTDSAIAAIPTVHASEPAASEAGLIDIRSPMVGTFYHSPQPGAAPFVSIGARVEPNTIIAIIEVMKLMSSIPALTTGTVHEILIQDASLVEKGQLLMRVKPDAV